MKRNLLADFVASVKPPESGQKPYWDAKLPGFALRVSCGGGKTWVLRIGTISAYAGWFSARIHL